MSNYWDDEEEEPWWHFGELSLGRADSYVSVQRFGQEIHYMQPEEARHMANALMELAEFVEECNARPFSGSRSSD